ncbi:isoprenoid synthase domain-containing protein [Crucibulum laeve]|uniref:Isoprenoid synthase domain-containing protein n=1 Tax=Crucibulum laeve TaxID=68775 RepID=A0A5C3LZG2_9AGAR|nr:isoprenoid synthase domain-containing protein [Crucibulum laeve]
MTSQVYNHVDSPPIWNHRSNELKKPSFKSRLPCFRHDDERTSGASTFAREYLANTWPWQSAEECERFLDQDTDLWASFVFTDIPDDRLECVYLASTLGFLIDDVFESRTVDEMKQILNKLNVLITGTVLPTVGDQFEYVIFDIYRRIRESDPVGGLGIKYSEEVSRWIQTTTAHKAFVRRHFKSLDDYLETRFGEGGLWLTLTMINWVYGTPVPTHLANDPNIRALHILTGSQALLVNDIFSYRREVMQVKDKGTKSSSTKLHSAVSVAMELWNCGYDDAIKHIEDHISSLELQFEEIEEKLLGGYEGADLKFLEQYYKKLKIMCGGNAAWSVICGRYNRL